MKSFSIAERRQRGKTLRQNVPRTAQGNWAARADRRDSVEIVECSSRGRLAHLIPLRYGRMLRSPFTFLRGAPALMAADLAHTPQSGIDVQACGDCHLVNFGLFATPERNLIFDINDFDETLHGPWEWDLKRLAASFVVAARSNGIADQRSREIVAACGRSYRQHMREFSEMSPLDIWYYRIAADDLIAIAPDAQARRRREKLAERARARLGEKLFPKITEQQDGRHRFVEQPPVTTRLTDEKTQEQVREGMQQYRASLPDDRRYVFDRYRLEDFALRVVGIGSVATRCFVGLFFCDDKNPLLLQVKEARPSVWEPYAQKCPYEHQGKRVVVGQRLMQAASDIFLGWAQVGGHDYFVRQLRDMKFSVPVEDLSAAQLGHYAEACGWALARAHAQSGDPAMITGYLGRGDKFDVALTVFALAYADQVERDHAAFVAAERAGRIEAVIEPEEP
ncbi:MAG: DUF2252 domain-containing protein [Pirellulales bacterium]